jgi:hypothetical protein
LAILKGQEEAWICLASCATDVAINALVIFWVTNPSISENPSHHKTTSNRNLSVHVPLSMMKQAVRFTTSRKEDHTRGQASFLDPKDFPGDVDPKEAILVTRSTVTRVDSPEAIPPSAYTATSFGISPLERQLSSASNDGGYGRKYPATPTSEAYTDLESGNSDYNYK